MNQASLDILFGQTGQTVYYDSPHGRPSSAGTVAVYEDTSSDTSSSESALGSVSIENVNLTLNATSGGPDVEDPTKINLGSVSGLTLRPGWLLTAETGETETHEIVRIDSTTTSAWTRSPILMTCGTSATLQSTRLSATVDSTWVADVNNLSDPTDPNARFRAHFLFTAASLVRSGVVFFNLTRYPFVLTVNPGDVDELSRGWLGRLHPDDIIGAGQAVIRQAQRQVRLDLHSRRLSASAQRNNELMNEAIVRKAIVLLAKQALLHGGTGTLSLEQAQRDYDDVLTMLAPMVVQQVTSDGAAGRVKPGRIMRR